MTTHKTIVVTGTSSGIGKAIAEKLLNKNYSVLGIARRDSQAGIQHKRFQSYQLDLSDLSSLPNRLQDITQAYPDITAAVCNAGQGRFGALEEFSYEQIRQLIDLNFTSQAYLSRAVLPAMKKYGFGHIVYIGSEAAVSGGKRGAIYSASKFALRGLAQSLREECSHNHVRITMINPGMVKTDFFSKLSFSHGDAPENYVEADDVANAVLLALEARPGTVIDEINLSPLKKVIR